MQKTEWPRLCDGETGHPLLHGGGMSDDWKDILAGALVAAAILTTMTLIGALAVHLHRSTQ